jgi:hypothetical protein
MVAGGVRPIERGFAFAAIEAAETTPFLSMSPPRIPNAGAGTLNTSDSPVAGSNRRNAGGPPNTPTVYQIEPSTGDGITA